MMGAQRENVREHRLAVPRLTLENAHRFLQHWTIGITALERRAAVRDVPQVLEPEEAVRPVQRFEHALVVKALVAA
jgi:hypothetical protein